MHAAIRGSSWVLMLLLVVARAASAQDLRTVEFSERVTVGCHVETARIIRFELDIRLRVDPSLASRRITEALKAETEAIWAPYGVRLRWTDADASRAGGVSLDAGVVRQLPGRQGEQDAVLGSAVLGPGAPAWRPVRVSFDATRSVLAHRSTTGRAAVKGVVLDRELTRALGRVLAHEIGHVLIGASHDRAGLMRATFSANELAEPDNRPFRLTRSGVERLKSRLRALSGSQSGRISD